MKPILKISDGLQRVLGFLDDDPLLDEATKVRMTTVLTAAENWVQNSIGTDDISFYAKDDVKDLYTTACNAVASNWFNHPSTSTVSTTAEQIIGQLRGTYDLEQEEKNNGTASERGPA